MRYISHFDVQVKTAPRILPVVSQCSVRTSTHHIFTPTDVRSSVRPHTHSPANQSFQNSEFWFFSCIRFPSCCLLKFSLSSLLFLYYCVLSPPSLSLFPPCLYLTFLYSALMAVFVSSPHYRWLQTVQSTPQAAAHRAVHYEHRNALCTACGRSAQFGQSTVQTCTARTCDVKQVWASIYDL